MFFGSCHRLYGFFSLQAAPFRLQLMTTTKANCVCNSVSWQYQNVYVEHTVVAFSYFFQASLQSKCRDHNLNVTQVFRTVLCFDTSNKFVISGCTWFSFCLEHFPSLDFPFCLYLSLSKSLRGKWISMPGSRDAKKIGNHCLMFANWYPVGISLVFRNYTL